MHKPTNQPAFLDDYSDLERTQIDTINTIVRTQYNRFLGKIEQKQLSDGETTFNIKQPSWRVSNIKDYNYSGVSAISFDFDTSGMVDGVKYKAMELQPAFLTSTFMQQTGFSDLDATSHDIDYKGLALNYYGNFFFESLPQSNTYFITFRAFRGEGETTYLPNTNWRVTLLFYSEK